jgi:hypothetical protein
MGNFNVCGGRDTSTGLLAIRIVGKLLKKKFEESI